MDQNIIDLVSVILPVYNCEKYIAESISSILNQTYLNLELIIINDGSTDSTKNIIETFVENDPRIKYFENEKNVGVSWSTNFGISKSKGFYLAKQDADDISLHSRIENQVNYFKQNPEIDLLTGRAIYFDRLNNHEWISGETLQHDEIKFKLLLGCPIMNPTLMLKKSFIEKNQLYYNLSYNGPEDYDFFTRAIFVGKFFALPNILIKYRIHDSVYRLNHELKKQSYKFGTLQIRTNYFNDNSIKINYRLLAHYENLFYGDANISLISLKKTFLFYLKFKKAIAIQEVNSFQEAFINDQINKSFYNSIYQFSKIGFLAFSFYNKYATLLGRFDTKKEIKFFIKCMVAK